MVVETDSALSRLATIPVPVAFVLHIVTGAYEFIDFGILLNFTWLKGR